MAQPAITNVVPANMATGVSPTAPVIFTFSEAMDPVLTSATFMDGTTYQPLPMTQAWSSLNRVLTCTPAGSLPANRMIVWMVDGENPTGVLLGGTTAGMFTTGGGNLGCDPGATMPSFTVSKSALFVQNSAAAPVPNPSSPNCFLACMTLSCPRAATNVSLRLPTAVTTNMALSPLPGHLTLSSCGYASAAALDTDYPSGDYLFNIQSAASNQQVTVNFSGTLTLPAAPHLSNFTAAQAIDPTQPFVLAWDPFAGGTAADCIYLEIYGGAFQTPALGMPGALNGTATSVTIPAGTLQPNQQYSGALYFYHYYLVTNASSHLALTYRCASTEVTLATTSGTPAVPLVITNAALNAGTFSFDVMCSTGQVLVVETNANCGTALWNALCTTNSPGQRVRIVHPNAIANRYLFYRVRKGP